MQWGENTFRSQNYRWIKQEPRDQKLWCVEQCHSVIDQIVQYFPHVSVIILKWTTIWSIFYRNIVFTVMLLNSRGHMLPSSTVDFGWFVAFDSINIFRVKIDWNYGVFFCFLHHPICLQLHLVFLSSLFTCLNVLVWLRITDEEYSYGLYC